CEVMDSTQPFFIGPHFSIPNDTHPFGIARYAPWSAVVTDGKLSATITGKDEWNGSPLAEKEGQGFKIQATAELDGETLNMHHSIVSDTDSLVGGQFPLRLSQSPCTIEFDSKDHYYSSGKFMPLPSDWSRSDDGKTTIHLNQPLDMGIHPYLNPVKGFILLTTNDFRVEVGFSCQSQESSCYICHQLDSSFVLIGAVSSQNPWKPNLSVSSIGLSIRIH
nr:hypothetical protein [Chlamydiota bacterium]